MRWKSKHDQFGFFASLEEVRLLGVDFRAEGASWKLPSGYHQQYRGIMSRFQSI